MKFNLVLYILTVIGGCKLYEKEEILLSQHVRANGEKIAIYFVAVGATAQDNIQVRRLKDDKVLAFFERYNYLKESRLVNDSTLRLIISDTSYNEAKKFDTLTVELK